MSRRNEDVKYLSFHAAVNRVMETREFQTKTWPSLTEPNRPFEEWLVLADVYIAKLKAIYAETPSYIDDGKTLNVKGLERIEKYAAIVANLYLWAVQSAKGEQMIDLTVLSPEEQRHTLLNMLRPSNVAKE